VVSKEDWTGRGGGGGREGGGLTPRCTPPSRAVALLQCVAVSCSMLHHVAVYCSVLQSFHEARPPVLLQGVAGCCRVSQCVAVMLQCVILCCSYSMEHALRLSGRPVAVCYRVLQCVAVCHTVLQSFFGKEWVFSKYMCHDSFICVP